MNFIRSASIAISLFGLGLGASIGVAHADADATIKARQACMKSNGAMMGVMVPMIKGEKPYDAAAIEAVIKPMNDACADWANFWTEESMKGSSAETWAKPEIWSDKAGFEAAGGEAYKAMEALRAAKDEASFKAAFPAVGASCQGCHEKFRRPKS